MFGQERGVLLRRLIPSPFRGWELVCMEEVSVCPAEVCRGGSYLVQILNLYCNGQEVF